MGARAVDAAGETSAASRRRRSGRRAEREAPAAAAVSGPAEVVASRARPGLRALAALAAAALCAAGGGLAGYWTGARPLRARLGDSRAAETRLAQSNAVLRGRLASVEQQLAAVPELQGQVAALETQKQQLAARNERIIANTRPLLRGGGAPLLPAGPAASRPLLVPVGPLRVAPVLPSAGKGAKAVAAKPPAHAPVFGKPSQSGPRSLVATAGPHPALASTGAAHHADEVSGGMALLAPVGASLVTDRPSFSWRPMPRAESYVVIVYDASGDEVARSPAVTDAAWTPSKSLPRGQTYQWEVVAYRDGQRVGRAPQPPAPSAKFTIAAAPRAAVVGGG